MMDISNLTDQEKSVLLAKAMGWPIEQGLKVFGQIDWIIPPEGDMIATLYNPVNMALAWRVLNWAQEQQPEYVGQGFLDFWDVEYPHLYEFSPAEAQRLWLDKILELAIEAGLVKESTLSP
jgi:hypothetical protein